jgi:uncharacterized protein YwgA
VKGQPISYRREFFRLAADIPERLWIPLLILENVGTVYTKTKFQKLTFLVQYLSHLDFYDFKRHFYGPYSDSLELDTTCYTQLIECNIHDSLTSFNQYYTFRITDKGLAALGDLKKRISPYEIERVEANLKKYANKSRCDLLDEVYSQFALKHGESNKLVSDVKSELLVVKPPLIQCSATHMNRQSTFVLSALEIVELILESLSGVKDTVQRGVVANLAREIIQKVSEIAKDIIPPNDSHKLRPRFVEIAELQSYLIHYCDSRNIFKDPFTQPLEKTFTEDEAKRLAQALSDIQLPLR